jgi:hypothetical protein
VSEDREENTGKTICPYCASSDECDHCLAMIDRTFNECDAGYASERYNQFQTLIDAAFVGSFQLGDRKECPWSDEIFCELWQDARKAYSPNDEEVSLEPDARTSLIIELLEAAGGVRCEDSDAGPPGFSSALTVFYAKNPQSVFETALANLRRRLTIPN